jgi:hypothetical protein
MLVLDMQGVIGGHTYCNPGHKVQPENRVLYTRNMQKSSKNRLTFGQTLPYVQGVPASTIDACPRRAVCLAFFLSTGPLHQRQSPYRSGELAAQIGTGKAES